MNKFFCVNILEDLHKFVRDEVVNFCRIAPPFNFNRQYNQIYNRALTRAFIDT